MVVTISHYITIFRFSTTNKLALGELDAAGTGLAEKSEAVVLIHSELKWEGGRDRGELP